MKKILYIIITIIIWYFIIGFIGVAAVVLFSESFPTNLIHFFIIASIASVLYLGWYKIHKKYANIQKNTTDMNIDKYVNEIDKLQEQLKNLTDEKNILKNKLQMLTEDDKKIENLKNEIDNLKSEKETLLLELKNLKDDVLLETVKIEKYENISSQEIKNQLQMLQLSENELIKNKKAIIITDSSNIKSTLLNSNIKQILRNFNVETKSIIDNLSVKNIDSCRVKITKSYNTINSIYKTDFVAISPELYEMKLKELTLIYEYFIKLEQEKEQQKAIKEQLVEEEKVRREIDKEKQRIEKEETQFKNEVTKLMKYMASTQSDIEKQLYIDKIKELENKLKLLEKDKENVLEREQNTRAGYVYIISNIGSFGENIYKIGMTRRLEPMDRIKELGDASVPFQFDVHALIFSDDAPALENILHQTFKNNQVNKLNPRKEFYNIDLEKIKEIVKSNYNNTVNFTDYAEAYEYRESQKILASIT